MKGINKFPPIESKREIIVYFFIGFKKNGNDMPHDYSENGESFPSVYVFKTVFISHIVNGYKLMAIMMWFTADGS